MPKFGGAGVVGHPPRIDAKTIARPIVLSSARLNGKCKLPSTELACQTNSGCIVGETPPLPMNLNDAAQRSLGQGIEVRVPKDRGEIVLRLALTDDVLPTSWQT